jgi:hypothetical protein
METSQLSLFVVESEVREGERGSRSRNLARAAVRAGSNARLFGYRTAHGAGGTARLAYQQRPLPFSRKEMGRGRKRQGFDDWAGECAFHLLLSKKGRAS